VTVTKQNSQNVIKIPYKIINDYENKTKIEMKEVNIIKLFFDKN